MKKLAIFASSNASDLPVIIQEINFGILRWKCIISCWVVNKEWVWAIEKFKSNNIEYIVCETKNRELAYEKIHNLLIEHWIDFVICVWWMNIMPASFVNKWNKKIINVHPSLLPNFPWAQAISDAIQAWVKTTWCTVHFIDEWIDTWEIIMQKEVEISTLDSIETLKLKIQKAEQEIYPQVILKILNWKHLH